MKMITGNIKPVIVRKAVILVFACLILLSVASTSFAAIPSSDIVSCNGMFNVDKWMLQSDGQTPVTCTSPEYSGKTLQEVINFVVVDAYATSASDAQSRLAKGLNTAGYIPSIFHYSGYTGWMAGTLYQQQPSIGAFADKAFYDSNIHHARAFGPYYYNDAYYTIASFSTESCQWLPPEHVWVSYNTARDDCAAKLVSKSGYVRLVNIDLQNQIPANNPTLSTGDFDGVTVFMQTPKNINNG